ncbi:MAG: hypothetical protein V7641_1903 [Blastocatellia bacterium]
MLWANRFQFCAEESERQMLVNRRLVKLAARLLLIMATGCMALAQTTGNKPSSPRPLSGETMDTVYLNHFFLTVDAESYNAIQSSAFLRDEFAPFEQRTTVRQDLTYTGSYFYGAHTYFEFFEAGRASGRVLGASGIAFGVEAPGASLRLKPRLEAAFKMPVAVRPITRRVGDRDLDWFYMTTADGTQPSLLQTWVMEYRDSFLNDWYGELKPATRGITRAEILERYTARLGENDKRRQKLLEDVIEITLALPDAEGARLLKACEAFGYRATNSAGKTRCAGPGITLTLIAPNSYVRGIIAVKFSLRHAKQGQKTYRFGKSVLQFNDDRTALWTFQS